jgi:DNA ligase-1
MRRFLSLYQALDQTTRTSEKLAALRDYFRAAPPADAAWALYFLTGRRVQRAVSSRLLRDLVVEQTQFPQWLVNECYDAVGDLSETVALLLPPPTQPRDWPLHELAQQRIVDTALSPDAEKRKLIAQTWRELDAAQRFLFHKLISGTFRVGVAQRLVVRALAEVAGVEAPIMAHRVMGHWSPTEHDYAALLSGGVEGDVARPYPFFLASPLTIAPAELGAPADWLAEWKWDGMRAQLIRRAGRTLLWSRGEDLITDQYPSIADLGPLLPDGTVLDGELLAWQGDRPLPFAQLQKRIGRKNQQPSLFDIVPVVFMAYDLLEDAGVDARDRPLRQRRARLEQLVSSADAPALRLSPAVTFSTWDELAQRQRQARQGGVEGVMLKRLDSPYRVGRPRGDWWKWKIDPYTVDAVLIYAQPGHGRRASLFTDYTFGVWDGGELVPIAKAYSGLDNDEIRQVDRFVRRHTVQKHGPVRVVEPVHVFELAFEGIARSDRHRSGIALRFPRMARWRTDKKPADADTLQMVRALLEQVEGQR